MTSAERQADCEKGQAELMRMEYLRAESTLAKVEQDAWSVRDFDTLSRIYMPLQEARRQRRQRAGEGIVCLDLWAEGPDDRLDALHVIKNFSHGQLLVAGWGMIDPAGQVRAMAEEQGFYLDTFLAAAFPTNEGRAIAIIPSAGDSIPSAVLRSIDELQQLLPPHALLLRDRELPAGSSMGTFKTYGRVMALWERLHAPFLAEADSQGDLVKKMEGYRRTIRVDYACELAHQKLSDAAREMGKRSRAREVAMDQK